MSTSDPSRLPQGLMKIGDLARKTGKTVRALHLYEELGLLDPASRSGGGFRLYGADEIARVYWITKLQELGFSLPQIQSLLASVAASATAPEAMDGVRELYRQKLDETRAQVMRLLQLERDLVESLAYLEGCRVCREPAAPEVCTSCASDRRGDEKAPSLVAEIHRGPRRTVDDEGAAKHDHDHDHDLKGDRASDHAKRDRATSDHATSDHAKRDHAKSEHAKSDHPGSPLR